MAETELETLGIISGITAIGLVIISLIFGLIFIARSREDGNTDWQRFLTGLGIIGMGGSWCGISASFLTVLLTGEPLGVQGHMMALAWSSALGATVWTYLVFSLVKREWRYYAAGIVGVVDLIYLSLMYFVLPFSDVKTRTENDTTIEYVSDLAEYHISKESGLPDSRFLGIPSLCIIFYIFIVVFVVGGTFFWASMKTQVEEIKWKARIIGFGMVVYGPAAAVDAFLAESAIILLATRATLVTTILLVYLGYSMPNWLRKTLNLPITPQNY